MCHVTWYALLPAACLQAAIRRGSARSMDHAQLVHAQWTHAAMLGLNLHILRVPTDDNIADLPSREACGGGCLSVWRVSCSFVRQEFELLWLLLFAFSSLKPRFL